MNTRSGRPHAAGHHQGMNMSEVEEFAVAGTAVSPQPPPVRVFDREGRQVPAPASLEIVIEPESFLADGSDQPVARKIAQWVQAHGAAPAVAVRFPKFTDGRGFSVAARLRESGYQGELHALGEISQDLVFHLRRVGFTHFHLENPGIDHIERSVLEPFSGYYQAAADGSRAPWQET